MSVSNIRVQIYFEIALFYHARWNPCYIIGLRHRSTAALLANLIPMYTGIAIRLFFHHSFRRCSSLRLRLRPFRWFSLYPPNLQSSSFASSVDNATSVFLLSYLMVYVTRWRSVTHSDLRIDCRGLLHSSHSFHTGFGKCDVDIISVVMAPVCRFLRWLQGIYSWSALDSCCVFV